MSLEKLIKLRKDLGNMVTNVAYIELVDTKCLSFSDVDVSCCYTYENGDRISIQFGKYTDWSVISYAIEGDVFRCEYCGEFMILAVAEFTCSIKKYYQ